MKKPRKPINSKQLDWLHVIHLIQDEEGNIKTSNLHKLIDRLNSKFFIKERNTKNV